LTNAVVLRKAVRRQIVQLAGSHCIDCCPLRAIFDFLILFSIYQTLRLEATCEIAATWDCTLRSRAQQSCKAKLAHELQSKSTLSVLAFIKLCTKLLTCEMRLPYAHEALLPVSTSSNTKVIDDPPSRRHICHSCPGTAQHHQRTIIQVDTAVKPLIIKRIPALLQHQGDTAAMSEQQQQQSPLDLHKVPNETYCAVMQGIEVYLEAQQELATALKAGLFDLAKAKYSLGPGSVGQQCYPGEMQAAVGVLRQPPQQQQDSLFDHFELCQQLEQCHIAAAKKPQQQLEPKASAAGAAAGRSAACKQQDDTVAAADSKHAYSSSSSSQSHDPLGWFSALPPPTLRSAQVQFKSALERAVAAANRVQELRQLLEELLENCSLNNTKQAAAAAPDLVATAES
jgi:hypothetical protein